MSTLAVSGLPRLRTGPRWFSAIACLGLLGVCALATTRELEGRRRVVALAREHALEQRHPAVAQTVNLIEGNDEAALLVAEALVGAPEAAPGVSTALAAQELVFQSLAGRPGSAYGRLLLGRSFSPDEGPARWARPLELAVSAAPGLELASSELGRRYLAGWESLSPDQKRKAEEAIGEAFRSPTFLRASFARAVVVLGPQSAVRALPDDSVALRLAEQLVGRDSLAAGLIGDRLKTAQKAPAASRPGS